MRLVVGIIDDSCLKLASEKRNCSFDILFVHFIKKNVICKIAAVINYLIMRVITYIRQMCLYRT